MNCSTVADPARVGSAQSLPVKSARARVVAIDGPAGAGKSTVAGSLAEKLGWRLLDTGAMYRCVALASVRAKIATEDEQALGELAATLRVELAPGLILLDGEDVSLAIRTPEISKLTSVVAVCPPVRSVLVGWQRLFAETGHGVVTEGRDQGTVVFPDALFKVFLTASPEQRARRRYEELLRRGETADLDSVLAHQIERDQRDAGRATGPMRVAEDALIFDTTGLAIAEIVRLLENITRSSPPYPWEPCWPENGKPAAPAAVLQLAQAWDDQNQQRLVALGKTKDDAARASGLNRPFLVAPAANNSNTPPAC